MKFGYVSLVALGLLAAGCAKHTHDGMTLSDIDGVVGDVTFDTGKTAMTAEQEGNFVRVAHWLRDHKHSGVHLTGHADGQGTAAANKRLTEKRLETVRDYLVKNGAHADQITMEAMGEAGAKAQNSPEDRAVRIHIKHNISVSRSGGHEHVGQED